MKQILEQSLRQSVDTLQKQGRIPCGLDREFPLILTKNQIFGDFASNLGFILSYHCQQSPQEWAQAILEVFPKSEWINNITISKSGFINFYMKPAAFHLIIQKVLEENWSLPYAIAQTKASLEDILKTYYRLCIVLSQLESNLAHKHNLESQGFHTPEETLLILLMEEIVFNSEYREGKLLWQLKNLSEAIQNWFNKTILICENTNIRTARFFLMKALRELLNNVLTVLGAL